VVVIMGMTMVVRVALIMGMIFIVMICHTISPFIFLRPAGSGIFQLTVR
jgi:hypothetical protein